MLLYTVLMFVFPSCYSRLECFESVRVILLLVTLMLIMHHVCTDFVALCIVFHMQPITYTICMCGLSVVKCLFGVLLLLYMYCIAC